MERNNIISMEKKVKDLLPVGSVVLLKNAKKKLIIIGIMQINNENGKKFDYLAVTYPEGYIGSGNNFLFNHVDIDEVVFEGYADTERESFAKAMDLIFEYQSKQEAQAASDANNTQGIF